MMKSNRTPFTDVCRLMTVKESADADGYVAERYVRGDEIFCSFSRGSIISEYYEAEKLGIRLSGTVEVWEDEYHGETRLMHEGKVYSIGRAHPTGHGTLELTIAEVMR